MKRVVSEVLVRLMLASVPLLLVVCYSTYSNAQDSNTWKISTSGVISDYGQPQQEPRYLNLEEGGDTRLIFVGDSDHPIIRFLSERRGTIVTITVTGGTPE